MRARRSRPPPSGPQAVALAVLLVQPELVEHLVRLLDVVRGVERPVLRAREVERALTGRGRARLPEPEDEGLVDLRAVDAVGQRDAELAGGEPLRDLGVLLEALVAHQADVRPLVRGVQVDPVAAPLLVLEQDRQLADVDVAGLRVVLPGDRPQVDGLQALAQRHLDPVDVGELVAGGIHPDAVRVPLEDEARRVDRGRRLPGGHDRQVGVEGGVVAVLHQGDPAIDLQVRGLPVDVGLRGVLGVELLEVVGGGEAAQAEAAVPGVVADAPHRGQHDRQGLVGIRRDELDRAGVHLPDGDRLAVDRHDRKRGRHQVLVLVEVLEPEHEVVRGERLPVAPLHPAPQEQRGDLARPG